MPTPAEVWQQRQRRVASSTAAAVLGAWKQVVLGDVQRSFEAALPDLVALTVVGQVAAAAGADLYVKNVLAADGLAPDRVATVTPQRFAGITSDGRTLPGLLTQPLIRLLYLRTKGADDATALAGGRLSLQTLVSTEIYDTGRDAVSVSAALDRQVTGYVRQVSLPACSRCVVLAGKFFRRNAGFDRHPRCDCMHVPSTQVRRADQQSDQDPHDLFRRMSRSEQDRAFGANNAEVIRRGGDIGQVVNARRGMATAGDNWTTANARKGQRRPSPGFLLKQSGDDPEKFALALDRAGYL